MFIEQIADMLRLGYTEHEVVRILAIPPHLAESIIQQAEQWNDEEFVPWTDDVVDDMATKYEE